MPIYELAVRPSHRHLTTIAPPLHPSWDITRREFCNHLHEKQNVLPPADWMALINLSAFDAGIGLPLPSGNARGELSFDPDVVQNNFFKAQAAIAIYAEGTQAFTSEIHPTPAEPEYVAMIEALSKRFAASFIRGGEFVVAGLGDSTMAGADNCYYGMCSLPLATIINAPITFAF
jgi:hypothetical protein